MIDPDSGLIELQKILNGVEFGDFDVRIKKHKGVVARIEVPFTHKYRLDFARAGAYIIDKLKEAQLRSTSGKNTNFTLTVDVKSTGEIYIVDQGYETKTFDVPV